MKTDEQVSINAQDLINQLSSNFAVKVAQYEQTIANLQVTNQVLSEQIAQLKSQLEAPTVEAQENTKKEGK